MGDKNRKIRNYFFKLFFEKEFELLEESERLKDFIIREFPGHSTIITGVGMARATSDCYWILQSVKRHRVKYNPFNNIL